MSNKHYKKVEEFDQKLAFNERLQLDKRDREIMALIQENSSISQEEIAKKIKLSQPSVGARIKKLKEKGILWKVNGVNFKVVDLHLAKVDVTATDTAAVINEFKYCPFFLNALITSGRHNICLFFMSTDLKRLEGIVNHHLRGSDKVKDVEMNIVITTENDFVLPLNINYDDRQQVKCSQDCRDCV